MAIVTSTLDLARNALRRSPHSTLRKLMVEQSGDALIISGSVSTFYQKQMAQEAIRAVCHDVELDNTVNVESVR